MAQVVIMMGSKSDEEKVSPCVDVLRSLGISYLFTVSSAHRTPERTEKILREQEAAGAKVFICAAGMAAHLAGAVAARTTRPVIGIPVSGGLMGGMDAMLATVQMPPGFPVATVAMDKAGARNAAWPTPRWTRRSAPPAPRCRPVWKKPPPRSKPSTAASRPVLPVNEKPSVRGGLFCLAVHHILKKQAPSGVGTYLLVMAARCAGSSRSMGDGGSLQPVAGTARSDREKAFSGRGRV